ncbi:transglutaminase domain-containing protein [Candidatus Woesearchaeota archaeon]|nr:transglutaminase domain-containing protein [Candidatus Woesearchaeota archaeon]
MIHTLENSAAKKTALLFFLAFILLLSFPAIIAQETSVANRSTDKWIYNSDYLVLDVNLATTAEKRANGPAPYLDYVSADITFYPRENDLQKVLSREYTPQPAEEGDKLIFRWDTPRDSSLFRADMKSTVKISNKPMRITKSVAFPIQKKDIPDDAEEYTKPAKIIDVNADIVNLASQLAAGETDLMAVVDKIALWTTDNIKYDLSTVTAEATQQASWVMANKVGVCDELTSLFIALLRSNGIPARFVSGISYTNSDLFSERWGPHGWAEVYFPDYGWIPYDVTYGEYGFIDPTHITSKISADAEKITTKYGWRGKDVTLDIKGFESSVKIADYGTELSPYIDLDTEVFKGSVNFGSYNFVTATVKNKGAFYQPLDVFLSKTEKLTVLDNNRQHVLLKPYEEKKVFWRIHVDPELEKDFIYTFPVSVSTLGEVSQQKEFKAIKGGIMITKDRMEETITRMKGEEKKEYNTAITVECNADKGEFYAEESPMIQCTLTNKGNTFFKGLSVCIKSQCDTIDLGIQQQKTVSFQLGATEKGLNEIVIDISNDQLKEQHVVEFSVTDKPGLTIGNIIAPGEVGFKDSFSVNVTIDRTSDSAPTNVHITFKAGGASQTMDLQELTQPQQYQIIMSGSDLNKGQNEITVEAAYQDRLGNTFTASGKGTVTLRPLSVWQKAYVVLRNIGNAVLGVFS